MSGRTQHPSRCPRPRPGGGRCHSRRCPCCSRLWAGDQRVRLRANLEAIDGDVGLITITAPGKDHLWHDENGMVDGWTGFLWNKSAPGRFRSLHAAARARVVRKEGRCPQITRSWEYQRRGLLHVHIAFPLRSLADRRALDIYVEALCELRWRHGFGFVDRGSYDRATGRRIPMRMPAGAAAWYLAKYLAPTEKGKMTLSETVQHRDVPRLVVHVARDLTSATGVTMRNLRLKRRFFRAFNELGLGPMFEATWDPLKIEVSTADGEAALPPP
jgi:hypothetical protein